MHLVKFVIPLTLLASCVKTDQNLVQATADTTNPLGITSPASFNYQTTADAKVDITLLTNDDKALANVMVDILDKPAEENGQVLYTAITDANGKISASIKLPSYLKTVVVDPAYVGVMRNAVVKIEEQAVSCTLGGSESYKGNVIPVERSAGTQQQETNLFSGRTTAVPYHYLGTYSSTGKPNYLVNPNDVISAGLLSYVNASLPETKPVPDYHPDYLKDNMRNNIMMLKESDVWITFVHEGAGNLNSLGYFTYPTNQPPASPSQIDSIHIVLPNASLTGSGGSLTSGNKVKIGRFQPGTSISFCLIAGGWSNTTQVVSTTAAKYYSIDAFNPETTAANRRHTVLLHDNEHQLILAGFEDQRRDQASDNDFNDLIFYASSNPVDGMSFTYMNPIDQPGDTDGDGVSNVYDKFPTDPARAYINYYPNANTYGTIAFEDTWPNTGDYDMNDLVVDYQYTSILNAQNKAVEVFAKYATRASGAQFKNGFGVQFPFAPSTVSSVTGSRVTNNSVATLSSNGTEAGQSKAVFVAFDDIYNLMPSSGSNFINTVQGAPFKTPDTVKMKVSFVTPLTAAQFGVAPFNQFLISNKTRGREVHLPGEKPTDKVNTAYFNTLKDNTIPSQNRYYKTATNLPFAISVPERFEYPIEGKVITAAYLKFVSWSQSGGVTFADWYKNTSGYRYNTMIYKP
jgi:LruC domain-containing protein